MAASQDAYLNMTGAAYGQPGLQPPTVPQLYTGQVPHTTVQIPATTLPQGFSAATSTGGFPGGAGASQQQQLQRQQQWQRQQPEAAPPGAHWPSPQQSIQEQQRALVKPVAAQMAEQALIDPAMREAVRQQAVQLGGHAMAVGKYYGQQGVVVFQDYIEQGPRGISILCFVGGVTTSVLGFMSVCNFFGSVTDPFHYILSAYMFVFGIVTAVIEADPDSIGMLIPPVDRLAGPVTRAQAWLHDQCKLLTLLRGRGFFYLYQGTLMVTQCVLCPMFLSGLFNGLMGIICILMSFGIKPDVENLAVGILGPQRYSNVNASQGALNASSSNVLGSSIQAEHSLFMKAEASWRQNKEQLSGKACRELWALHQQATQGDCNVPKPSGVFNGSEKEQWRLWNGLQGMLPEEAKAIFVEKLQKEGLEL